MHLLKQKTAIYRHCDKNYNIDYKTAQHTDRLLSLTSPWSIHDNIAEINIDLLIYAMSYCYVDSMDSSPIAISVLSTFVMNDIDIINCYQKCKNKVVYSH